MIKNLKRRNAFIRIIVVILIFTLALSVVIGCSERQYGEKDNCDTGSVGSSDGSSMKSDNSSWNKDGTLKILAIGNSFSVDSMEYVYQIAKAVGIENIELGNLYVGGCSLETHLNNAKNDAAAYTYYTNNGGKWNRVASYKISDAVKSNDWDFISFQQASPESGVADSYDDLTPLMDIVQSMCTNKDVEFVWHMTWAYQSDCTHNAFTRYEKDQMTMYRAIVSAVQEKIVLNKRISKIIPNGTVIQNARTSYLGDTLTRDGYHMSIPQGRILTGVAMVVALVDVDWNNLDLTSVSSDREFLSVVAESVRNALDEPFKVTKSNF